MEFVECGWNERNGTTEYPEHTEVRQIGRVGPSGTAPYRMKMPPLRLGGVEGMGMRGVTRWRRGMRGSGECVSQIGGDGVRCWYGDIHVFLSGGEYHKDSTVSIQT